MILCRTPFRISLAGGSTDIPSFYRKHEPGMVLSLSINKYMYVIIKDRFDDLIHLGYTTVERVAAVKDIHHDIIRNTMLLTGVESGVEIHTISDIPSRGCGLGKSSAVTVGLVNALSTYKANLTHSISNQAMSSIGLASSACRVELDMMGMPIGKQDQYASALGGINFLTFNSNESVEVEPITLTQSLHSVISNNLLLFHSGVHRDASSIIGTYRNDDRNTIVRRELTRHARALRQYVEDGRYDVIGNYLNLGWEYKKRLSSSVSNLVIDSMYSRALDAGATGGKVTGAGGGGFLLLYCPDGTQDAVRDTLHEYEELVFNIDTDGSTILYNE